jgi:hypothetical protein
MVERTVANILTGYVGKEKTKKMLTSVLIQNKEYYRNIDLEDPVAFARSGDVLKENNELEEYIFNTFGGEF